MKVYSQCLQEIVKLTFTLNIRISAEFSSDVIMGISCDDESSMETKLNMKLHMNYLQKAKWYGSTIQVHCLHT